MQRRPRFPWAAALAAALIVALAASLWTLGSGGARVPAPAGDPGVESTAGAAGPAAGAEQRGPSPAPAAAAAPRQELAVAADAAAELATADRAMHPYDYALDVLVVDALGLPVAKQPVLLAPLPLDVHKSRYRTDHDGRLQLQWRARQPTMTVALALDGQQTFDLKSLLPGRPQLAVLCNGEEPAPPAARPARSALTPTGPSAPTDPDAQAQELRKALGAVLPARNSRSKVPAYGGRNAPRLRLGRLQVAGPEPLHECAVFAMAASEPTQPTGHATEYEVLQQRLRQLQSEVREATRTNDRLLQSTAGTSSLLPPRNDALREFMAQAAATRSHGLLPAKASIRGRVLDERGQPVPQAPMAWRTAADQPWQEGHAAKDGTFEVTVRPGSDAVALRAGGGAAGRGEQFVPVAAGGETETVIELRRGDCVRGRVVDDDGKPQPKALVEWHGVDVGEQDAALTDEDGVFELANCAGPGRLWLRRDGSTDLPLAAVSDVVIPGTEGIVLRPQPTKGSIALLPRLPAGCERFEVRALVWNVDAGIAWRSAREGSSGPLEVSNLPAGSYRVVVHADSIGAVDLGTHRVDGRGPTELGEVPLPKPGTVEFPLLGRGDVEALHRHDELFDVRVDTFSARTTRLLLPAGDYRWTRRTPAGELLCRSFAVRSGEVTVVPD